MGEMNGLDLMRECRLLNPRQKMILVSGTVDESIFANTQTRPDCFLPKPYQVQELVETVQALVKA
jgi:DNA-binding NarL/FixJ family response regulator